MLDEFLSEDPDEAEEDADADARAAAPAPAPVDAAASDVDEPPAAPSAPAAAAAPIGAAAATDAGDELFEDEVLDDPEVLDDEVLDDDATATGDDAASPPVPPDEGPAVAEEPAAQEPEPQQLWVGFRLRGVVLTEKRSGLLGGFKSSKASDAYFLEETSVNYKSETKPELRLCNGPDAAEDAPPERGADFTVALDATGLETLTMKLSAHPDGHNPVVVGEAVISVMELLKVGGASALFEGHVAGAWLEALVLGGPPRISKIAAAVTHAGAPFVGQAYALWSDLAAPQLAFECVVEPMGVHDLVAAAITPVADAMLEASACWLARSERARADAAAFDDDEEAQRYGARRVRIAILGARGLTRLDASGNVPKRSFSAVGSAVGSSWRTMRGLAQRLRDGEVPRLGMDDGGDSSCPSPFASAALHSPRRAFAVPLGRTNTEYATESPSWGANARAAGFCAHAKPSTEFMANAPTSRLIGPESASTCPLLEFYVRRDEAAASFILVDVMDERYSVAEGIAAVKLGTVRLPLPPFEAAASKMSTPQWVPVKLVQPGDAEGLQCALFVALHVSSLEAPGDEAGADAAFDDEMQRRSVNAARDVSKLHSWLEVAHIKVDPVAAKLVAADGSARQIAETARDGVGGFEQAETSTCNFEKAEGHDPKQDVDLQLHDIGWLRAHAKALARDGMRLRKFVDEANSASEANKSGFKPSKDKANLDVAATPTNLHVHLFEATRRAGAAAGPEDWDLWCGVTSGAPTVAATLGAQRGGVRKRRPSSGSSSESGLSSETAGHRPRLPVRRLESELLDIAAQIRRRRDDLLGAPVRAPAAARALGAAARAWEARAATCGVRKILVVAQALAIAANGIRATLIGHVQRRGGVAVLEKWLQLGVLVVFEALISTAGSELAMLEDAAAGIAALRRYTIRLYVEAPEPQTPRQRSASVDPAAAAVVGIRIPKWVADALPPALLQTPLRIVPICFAQGVDAKQTLANRRAALSTTFGGVIPRFGRTASGTSLNAEAKGLDELDDDSDAGRAVDEEAVAETAANIQGSLNRASLEGLRSYADAMLGEASATARLKHLNAAVERSKSDAFEKHWLILVEAERATRAVAGAFCVFCKSGKDRTGMAVTLATAMLIRQPAAAAEGGPEEKVMLEHANLLREHGARIRICLKNTGRKKYAFNVIQREFLPYPYRPPMSCIEDLVSSIANADTS